MDEQIQTLADRLEQLKSDMQELGKEMRLATRAIEHVGVPPPEALLAHGQRLRHEFEELRQALRTMGQALDIAQLPEIQDVVALQDLQALWEQVQVGVRTIDQRRAARTVDRLDAVLDCVLRIAHRRDPAFIHLADAQNQARELRTRLSAEGVQHDPELKALTEGTHPLTALLQLVEAATELDEEETQRLQEVVAGAYNARLATAALTGRLYMQPSEADTGATGSTVVPRSATPSAPSAPPVMDSQGRPQPSQSPPTTPDFRSPSIVAPAGQGTSQEREPTLAAPPPADSTPSLPTDESPPRQRETSTGNPPLPRPPSALLVNPPALDSDREVGPQPVISPSVTRSSGGIDPRSAPRPMSSAPVPRTDDNYRFSAGPPAERRMSSMAGTATTLVRPAATHAQRVPLAVPIAVPATALPASNTSVALPLDPPHVTQRPAGALGEAPAEQQPQITQEFIFQLIQVGNLSLAYHVAVAAEEQWPEHTPSVPSALVAALALAPQICVNTGEIAARLREAFANYNPAAWSEQPAAWEAALLLLGVAAALRPALMAPQTNAAALLTWAQFESSWPRLHAYCRMIENFTRENGPLSFRQLSKIRARVAWDDRQTRLEHEVRDWLAQVRTGRTDFQAASRIWQLWLEDGGLIQQLLEPILRHDLSQLAGIHAEVDRLRHDNVLQTEIARTDRESRQQGGRTDKITGPSRKWLYTHIQEALEYADRWVKLGAPPPELQNELIKKTGALGQALAAQRELVLKELADPSRSAIIGSAAQACIRAVDNLAQLFDEQTPAIEEELPTACILNGELLLAHTRLDDQWQADDVAGLIERAQKILQVIAADHFGWATAYIYWRDLRDHETTGRILEYLAHRGDAPQQVAQLSAARDSDIAASTHAAARELEFTRNQIEAAALNGLLTEDERNREIGQIDNCESALKSTLRFDLIQQQLKNLRATIKGQLDRTHLHAEELMQSLGLTADQPEYIRVLNLIDGGYMLTAQEFLDLLAAGEPLPEEQKHDAALEDFFPERALRIQDELVNRVITPSQIILAFSKHQNILGLPVAQLSATAREESVIWLQTWFNVGQSGAISNVEATQLMRGLGFTVQQITTDPRYHHTWLEVETSPLASRSFCPIPIYGSQANGRYRVFCCWNRPAADDLLADVGDTIRRVPVLVFHFGRMTEKNRRSLARLCREHLRTFLVIDDLLMIYLAAVGEKRLLRMFQCTLPFTYVAPYASTGGQVPPEMFYGRDYAIRQIIEYPGASVLYGGRQLGKTALLREVARREHAPEEGRITLWIDLKNRGIAPGRLPDDLWDLLTTELAPYLPTDLPAHPAPAELIDCLHQWLNGDPTRRILLLLDEADGFFEMDSWERFPRTGRLLDAANRASGRFKVVFAGLHNVLRTSAQSNQPFPGEAIQIGPLYNQGEAQDAYALITEPLGSIGYRFEETDHILAILAQTNYYPSLIQLYCETLLEHLRTRPPARGSGPPFRIAMNQLTDAKQSRTMHEGIRRRLMLTLDLDPRYHVIAAVIALLSRPGAGAPGAEGLRVRDIEELAREAWPLGFPVGTRTIGDTAPDEFEVLLDEMVGLGILRRVDEVDTVPSGRGTALFALRTRTVLTLLGTEQDLQQLLGRYRQAEAPLVYDVNAYHTVYPGRERDGLPRRGPLVVAQEMELRARRATPALMIGCNAAGVDTVSDFLSATLGAVVQPVTATTVAEFEMLLTQPLSERSGSFTLFLVPPSVPWDLSWVEVTRNMEAQQLNGPALVRTVFLADPQHAWELAQAIDTPLDIPLANSPLHGVELLPLRPWSDAALRYWLEDWSRERNLQTGDHELELSAEERDEIRQGTGNWPMLIEELYQQAQGVSSAWHEALQNLINREQLAYQEAFGLNIATPTRILRTLHEAQVWPINPSELATLPELFPNLDGELLRNTIRWADWLGLLERGRDGCWKDNPAMRWLLTGVSV